MALAASTSGTVFAGAIPDLYDRYVVPMLFDPYAADMAARVAALRPGAVLETAAGSGAVTRALAPRLGPGARYVVTDLNPPMLQRARAQQPADPRIEWGVADALQLDHADASFDVVLCQFGAMFFPDKVRGFAEARRVLKPGAPYIFSTWAALDRNDIPAAMWQAVLDFYPDDPPDFFTRLPHGYHDTARITADLKAAGFARVEVEPLAFPSSAPSARVAAVALCQGTPLRMEIEARDPSRLEAITDHVEAALSRRFGAGVITGQIEALVVTARG